jgi:tRNA(Ile)-lysidine synthase
MLAAAPREISLRVLKYLLAMIGGRAFWPNVGKVERLYSRIIEEKSPNAGTLSGCSVIRDRSGVLVCREERGLPVPVTVAPAKPIFWDGRFLINVLAASEHLVRLRLVALGSDGWREVVGAVPAIRQNPVPIQAAFSVPALADDRGIYAVPHLGYLRADVAKSGSSLGEVAFRPQITTFRPGYFLV